MPYPSTLCWAAKPLKWPYSRLLPPWTSHAVRLCLDAPFEEVARWRADTVAEGDFLGDVAVVVVHDDAVAARKANHRLVLAAALGKRKLPQEKRTLFHVQN
jgi:hypothetical protein